MTPKEALKQYRATQSIIGEILVKESKRDIESWLAIEQIRQYLNKNGIKRKEHSQLEKALERLELLEKENRVIKNSILGTTEIEWINENHKLTQENEKLKMVIEILKKYLYLVMDDSGFIINADSYLPKEEYELLKEVLGNDK